VKEDIDSNTEGSTGASLRSHSSPALRILVVDDDISICRFNTEALSRSGYGVDVAADGAAAWQALETDNYDLLITDNNMPKISGVELLKRLRAARMALPVIMVSGTIPTEELNRHPGLQLEATLLKPYTMEELIGTVESVLQATGGAREPIAPRPNWQDRPASDRLQL